MNKANLYLYAAALAGVLTITTFTYSVVLVPVWNWASSLPASIKSAATTKATPTPAVKSVFNDDLSEQGRDAPVITTQEKTPKPANCGKIIGQIKNGKTVSLPTECEESYRIYKEQEQAKLERERQQAESRQREQDQLRQERENQQRLEYERQREIARQQEQQRQREEAERTRAANLEKERLRIEAEERRRQEAREDAARRDAQRAAEQRERERQREAQKQKDALLRLGEDIRKKIFKRKN